MMRDSQAKTEPGVVWCDPPGTARDTGIVCDEPVQAVDNRPGVDRPRDGAGALRATGLLGVYDESAIGAYFLARFVGSGTATDADRSVRGAARFVLGILRRESAIREHFPTALTAGLAGEYCRWLCTAGAEAYGMSDAAIEHVEQAFRARLGDRVRQALEFRADVLAQYPLAGCPEGREDFLFWLICHGRAEHGFGMEEIWWYLMECAEEPARELVRLYLTNPVWQKAFPDGLTKFGQEAFRAWLSAQYRVELSEYCWKRAILRPIDELRLHWANSGKLRALAPNAFLDADDTTQLIECLAPGATERDLGDVQWWRAFALDDTDGLLEKHGVNVLGHFCCPFGLQQAALSTVHGLEQVGVRTSRRNVPVDWNVDRPNRGEYLGMELFDISLLHVQPEPFFKDCYPRAGLARREDVYRIGVWFWELESVPSHWSRYAEMVQEIWAPTDFVAEALRRCFEIPVVRMLPGVEVSGVAEVERSRFGLRCDDFVFLFMFDMCSVMQRKNPLGLIRAYQQAFGDERPARLVIKVSRGSAHPDQLAELAEAAHEADVTLIDEVMSREESYGLINMCDCYVSLHRSEGLGLTMAEAMLLGKPVIATGYSGNMEFMTPENSLLVDFRRTALEQEIPPYPQGGIWAEPSEEHAAHWMRWVYENDEKASVLGKRGQDDVRRALSVIASGRRMAARLDAIRSAVSTIPSKKRGSYAANRQRAGAAASGSGSVVIS